MTTVRIITTRRPRWWQQHGRLTLAVTLPSDLPTTITVAGGTRADISRQLERRLGVIDWAWS